MRCYVHPSGWSAQTMVLGEEEAHHLVHVMRAELGQPVRVFDGAGREAEAQVAQIRRDEVVLEVRQQFLRPKPALALVMIQAVPREQKMDLIIQKATELGASEIYPVVTDRAVVRLRPGDDGKSQRWDRIALNAAKQCGTAWLPEVHPVGDLVDVLPGLPRFDLLLNCSLEPDARPLRAVLAEAKPLQPRSIAFMVGPEGDFSTRELAAARQAGARPVNLGALVLRAETASLYMLSVLKYEFTT